MSVERTPTDMELLPLLDRAIELAAPRLERETVRLVSEIFQVLLWDFEDCGVEAYLVIDETGGLSFAAQPPRAPDGAVKMHAATLHDLGLGRVPVMSAFLAGRLRVQGLPITKLQRFMPLFSRFLEGYRQAWQERQEAGSGEAPA